MTPKSTRREFIKKAAFVAGMPTIIPASVLGRNGNVAPSNRIAMGVIGIGPRGRYVLENFLKQPDAQFVTVCDVQSANRRTAKRWWTAPIKTRTATRAATCWRFSAATTSTRC